VFHDVDGDALFDDTIDTPFAGVLVTLRAAGQSPILQTTLTDADGVYLFDTDLLQNTSYDVSVALPTSYQPTPGAAAVYNTTLMRVVQPHTTAEYGSVNLDVDFPFVLQFNVSFDKCSVCQVTFLFV
jgi:hypothetical protein